MEWEEKDQVKKGNIGEAIVQSYLEGRGWTVYTPKTKGAHWFDLLCCKGKEQVIALDVKTKARFNKWNAQGINIRSYNQYLNFLEVSSINFYLIFIDDKTGDVHLADLNEIKNKGFTPNNDKLIAWKLTDMKLLFRIEDKMIEKLSSFDTRNYKFKPEL